MGCLKQDKIGLRWHIYGLVMAALLPQGPDEDPHLKGLNTHAVLFQTLSKTGSIQAGLTL